MTINKENVYITQQTKNALKCAIQVMNYFNEYDKYEEFLENQDDHFIPILMALQQKVGSEVMKSISKEL